MALKAELEKRVEDLELLLEEIREELETESPDVGALVDLIDRALERAEGDPAG